MTEIRESTFRLQDQEVRVRGDLEFYRSGRVRAGEVVDDVLLKHVDGKTYKCWWGFKLTEGGLLEGDDCKPTN